MAKINIRLPDGLLADVDAMVEDNNQFQNRSDAVRYALRELVQKGDLYD